MHSYLDIKKKPFKWLFLKILKQNCRLCWVVDGQDPKSLSKLRVIEKGGFFKKSQWLPWFFTERLCIQLDYCAWNFHCYKAMLCSSSNDMDFDVALLGHCTFLVIILVGLMRMRPDSFTFHSETLAVSIHYERFVHYFCSVFLSCKKAQYPAQNTLHRLVKPLNSSGWAWATLLEREKMLMECKMGAG